jgi:hypothetical protein
MLLVHDERDSTIDKTALFPSQLVPTECPDWMDNFDATVATCNHLEDLETTIARWADETVGKHFVPAKVQSIGVSVPDIVFTRAGKVLSYRLGHNSVQTRKTDAIVPSNCILPFQIEIAFVGAVEKS